ncbi:nucleotidyltransferase domain-containing protein [Agarivorans litoreus]
MLYLFGSQANNSATAQSDIDLALLLPKNSTPFNASTCKKNWP